MRRVVVLLLAFVVAGCGGEREHGTATLWVTKDRGAQLVYAGHVPAGLTAMQALDRKLEITTRYGGRFVQSIDGLSGSLSAQRDWFYFVNGIEGDRSAAEYRLHPGDLEWWDYRSWRHAMSVPVVIGAFPEPFLHGYDGSWRPTRVVYEPGARRAAQAIARVVHGQVAPLTPELPPNVNVVLVHRGVGPSSIAIGRPPTAPVLLSLTPRDALRLARDPTLVRFRYQGVP